LYPPLISKWRPVKETRSPETTIQRPPGIVREQTFEYDSIKSRQKEVNFNDPKKENLNLTNAEEQKNHYVKMQNQMRHFIMDSRRKPIVSNGHFSLDENDDFESPEPKLGAITKCFTTYGQSAHFQENGSASKSLNFSGSNFPPINDAISFSLFWKTVIIILINTFMIRCLFNFIKSFTL
jgi:hypothetical protein